MGTFFGSCLYRSGFHHKESEKPWWLRARRLLPCNRLYPHSSGIPFLPLLHWHEVKNACPWVGPSCYSPWFARMMRIFMESCVDILSSLTKRCEHYDLFVAFINIAAIVLSPFAPWNQMLMIVRSLGESKGWDPWRLLNIQYQYLNISIYFRSTEWGKHVWNIQKAKGFLSKIPSRF